MLKYITIDHLDLISSLLIESIDPSQHTSKLYLLVQIDTKLIHISQKFTKKFTHFHSFAEC